MFKINLQLFAEGGEGAAEGATATTGEEAVSPAAQEASVDSQPSPDTEDRKAQFERFKKDYKAEYDAEVQGIVKDRLAKSKAQNSRMAEQLNAIGPLIAHMAQKYGKDVNDITGLMEAFENDDAIYEDEAYERNMTVDQVKEWHRIERENEAYRRREEEEQKARFYAELDRQAQELQQLYPQFDLQAELDNEDFVRMLRSGVPIRTAYEVAHHDEFVRGAMQFGMHKANEKLTNAVASNKARPTENGLSANAPAVTTVNIQNLTREQIEDIKRRAQAGEVIDFRH